MEETKRTILSRDSILGRSVLKRKEIEVPELGGTLIIRELNGTQGADFQRRSLEVVDGRTATIRDAAALANLNALVIVWSAITEDGQPLFTKNDIPALNELGSSFLDLVGNEVLKLSGLDKAGRGRAEKN